MEKVLVDGSTVVFAARLLAGEDQPSAVNLFDLALLVESLILHGEVIVLSTDARGRTAELEQAAASFGASVRVEHREVGALLWEYVQANGYDEYGHAPAAPADDVRLVAARLWKAITARPGDVPPAAREPGPYGRPRDLYGDLFLADVDPVYREDVQDYAALLEQVYARATVTLPAGRLERATRRLLGAGPRTANPAEGLRGASAVRVAYRSLPAYEHPELWDRSPFQDGLTQERLGHRSFWEGVVIRAHLYLIASALLGAPYKADALRWPICWKFFGAGGLEQVAVDEHYVRLAEDFERRRIESFNDFAGRPAVLARLPLFLHAVLASSTAPGDVVEQALAIRASKTATRFREHMRELSTSVSDGELEPVLRGISALGAALSKDYGVDRNEVIWSLLSAGAKTAADGASPAGGVELAKTAAKGAKGVAAWQRQRKFALISKTLHEAARAKTFEHQVTRVFGAGLGAGDRDVLDRLQAYGRAH